MLRPPRSKTRNESATGVTCQAGRGSRNGSTPRAWAFASIGPASRAGPARCRRGCSPRPGCSACRAGCRCCSSPRPRAWRRWP
jgi:hypothetical protein